MAGTTAIGLARGGLLRESAAAPLIKAKLLGASENDLMKWPGLRILKGPTIAGLGPGMELAVEVPSQLRLLPRRGEVPVPFLLDRGSSPCPS